MLGGSSLRAARSTAATPCDSEVPGWRSKEMVTEGSWPAWVTASGPTPAVRRARVVGALDLEHGVLDRLVVEEILREQGLARGLDVGLPAAEIEEQVVEREPRPQGRL